MVLDGEAQFARQIVTVSNCEGKIIAYAKPQYPAVRSMFMSYDYFMWFIKSCEIELSVYLYQIKGGDTSTAESGSEAEDITSPKAPRNYIAHCQLTPVREEVTLGKERRTVLGYIN